MGKKLLFTADLHLDHSDRFGGVDSSGRTQRLWEKLHVLKQIGDLAASHDADLVIGGDITEQKDRLPGVILNAFFDWLHDLDCSVYLYLGQHDFMLRENASIQVIKHFPNVHYIPNIGHIKTGGKNIFFISHQMDEERFQQHVGSCGQPAHMLFMHQSVIGSKVGKHELESGFPGKAFGAFDQVFSGDIHMPQKIGNVTYVGTPYQNSFGEEDYICRVLLIDPENGGCESIPIIGPRFQTEAFHWEYSSLENHHFAGSIKPGVKYFKLGIGCFPHQLREVTAAQESMKEYLMEKFGFTAVLIESAIIQEQEREVTVSEDARPKEAILSFMGATSDSDLGGLDRERLINTGNEFIDG